MPTSLSNCCILQKTSTHIDSSKESVSVTEILPFTPLISLVCNLQIYTCFTSYDEKKRTLRKCFTSDLPFYPISCSFLRLFSPQHPLPYPTIEKIIQLPRMSFQLPHRMINFFSTVSSLTLSSSDWL